MTNRSDEPSAPVLEEAGGQASPPQNNPHGKISAKAAPTPARRPSKAKWLVLLAVIAVAWFAYHRFRQGATPAGPPGGAGRGAGGPVPIVEGVVGTQDVPIFLDGIGTVQAFNTVTIRTRVDGQLMRIAFAEGQEVKVGDVLAQIDPAPYQATLDQASARKAQDAAQLDNAKADLERYATLVKTETLSKQAFDTQRALVTQLEATLKADQAAIDSARVNLDYTTLRSPIDGRTGIRLLDQGNIVRAADATGIVVLTQLQPVSVVFTLPEQSLPRLQHQQQPQAAAPFPVLAVARDNTNVLAEGVLTVIDNQIDNTTGTIRLKATFPNDPIRLWPGQFINTRLRLLTRSNATVVPASVVQRGPDGAFAFVVEQDQTVRMQPVQVTQIERGVALIDRGLKPGDHVVVDGQYKLQNGSKVRPVEAQEGSGGPRGGKRPEGGKPGERPGKPADAGRPREGGS